MQDDGCCGGRAFEELLDARQLRKELGVEACI
jgi:hypothetical protein